LFSKIKEHPLFSIGFRPFFILTAIQAIIIPTIWISVYRGYSSFENHFFTAPVWHSHEMVYGFPLALICGFLLTASANWTGKPAIKGTPLIVLSLFWIMERIIFLSPLNSWLVLPLSSAFLVYFIYLMTQMLDVNTKNFRIFIPILLSFLFGKTLMVLGPLLNKPEYTLWSREIGLGLIQLIILVVAGRILPFFTNKKHPELQVRSKTFIELMSLLPLIIFIIPRDFINDSFFFSLCIWLTLTHIIRLYQYRPLKTINNQMLFILNAGYIWIIISFLLYAWSIINPAINFSLVPLHAFALGGLGSFAIGMLTRVSLGHTGRNIVPSKKTLFAFYCIHIGTAIRVFIPIFIPELYMKSLHHAAGWWTLGFCFFLFEYTKTLYTPRK
jgi:uncharacterized protein involved in response to NO